MNIYLDLTREFNTNRLRAVITSGQAVVLHKLAVMSKDGDWILREDKETLKHILNVLNSYNAVYRFGAPLDLRWLKNGWSSHFEFLFNKLRVRTDFFTRPPRISSTALKKIWKDNANTETPFVNLVDLAETKKTNREKDYAVIGEIARLMKNKENQILYSRSARDLLELYRKYPETVEKLKKHREVLNCLSSGLEKTEIALDAERRQLIHINEKRLIAYGNAAERWYEEWPKLQQQITGIPLLNAHELIVEKAETVLPFKPEEIP